MTICMCFVFEVFLLVDMSLLVLSGPQPILNLNFVLLFQIWWSLSLSSRCILWPRKGIFSAHRHLLPPALSKGFYNFSNNHGRRFLGFFFACCNHNIVFWISSFTFWPQVSRPLLKVHPHPRLETMLWHLQLVTLEFADAAVVYEAAHKVFTDNLSWICFSCCPEIPGKLARPFNCT